ncbi:MAG: hypothetical protein HZA53_16965 [Planctomycetes bacterium]|nr:hypothetical protein [Planctomycetota bacterium]
MQTSLRTTFLRALSIRAALASALVTGPVFSQGLGIPPTPPGNPPTASKVALGKALFWDEQLSSTRSIACGSCHVPEAGGIDPRTALHPAAARHPGPDGVFGSADDIRASAGVPRSNVAGSYELDAQFGLNPQVTPRRAPTVINAAFSFDLFWDGRANGSFHDPITGALVFPFDAALESVVAQPPVNTLEMGHLGRDWPAVVARIEVMQPLAMSPNVPAALANWIAGRSYPQLFDAAFGAGGVTAARTCMAIASYMRSLVSNQTPFDAFQAGNFSALTPQQQLGLQVFQASRCDSCHSGPTLSLFEFRYTGVRPRSEDLGRFLVTGNTPQRGAMKIPDLRNIGLRAPFFHNGGKATLDAVLDFYSAGGDFEVGTNDLLAAPIFGQARIALLDFLEHALLDPRVSQGLPPFDHPALAASTALVPQEYGTATPGSAGIEPRIHAVEPSKLGAFGFTLAVSGARSGGAAGLFVGPTQDLVGTPFQGATLHVVQSSRARFFRIGALGGAGPTGGFGSLSLRLPSVSSLIGTHLYAQWFVVDPHTGGNCSATKAVDILLF